MSSKLIIFDLDGVLVDACDWHRDAFIKAYTAHTDKIITNKYHADELNGLPTRVKLQKLGVDPELAKDIEYDKQLFTILEIKKQCKHNERLCSLLSFLSKEGYILGCFTNSIRATAKLMLELSGASRYLDIVLTNEDVDNSKPDPEGYNKIIDLFRVHPFAVTIIEDSDKGMQAARASKAKHVIRVANSTEVNIDNLLPKIYKHK